MYVPVRTARMHTEGLWCVSVSEPSKGSGATERSSSSRSSRSSSSSIARVCVSVCESVCVCEGWRGEERQTRQDSREKKRESGSRPSLSPPQLEIKDPRTRQDL